MKYILPFCIIFWLTTCKGPVERKTIEAMASGLPVVATDAAGCRDVVQDGYNGLRALRGNAQSVAECVMRLVDDDSLRASVLAGARESLERYNWDVVGRNYEDLYKEIT